MRTYAPRLRHSLSRVLQRSCFGEYTSHWPPEDHSSLRRLPRQLAQLSAQFLLTRLSLGLPPNLLLFDSVARPHSRRNLPDHLRLPTAVYAICGLDDTGRKYSRGSTFGPAEMGIACARPWLDCLELICGARGGPAFG